MKKTALLALAACSATSLLSTEAFAQDWAPAPAPAVVQQTAPFPNRDGFTIGFALGGGYMTADGEEFDLGTTTAVSLRVGGAINQRLLIQADLEGVRTADSDSDLAAQLNFFGVSATGYLHDRFYLVGGIGFAGVTVDFPDGSTFESDTELGLLFGLGVEVYQSQGFGLSLEARAITADFNGERDTGTSVQLGFQWW